MTTVDKQQHPSQVSLVEDELYESREEFRLLVNAIPQLVFITDRAGLVETVNEPWTHYTGLSKQQSAFFGWMNAIHADDLPQVAAGWRKALKDNTIFEAEFRLRAVADGSFAWHLARALPMRNSAGKVVKWFGTCTDIHSQRMAEEQRTAALVRERAALAASKLKTEFLARVSHELRTPLNAIVGLSDLIDMTQLHPEHQECFAIIRQSASELATLINDLLDYTKFGAHQLKVEKVEFNLRELVRATTIQIFTAHKNSKCVFKTFIDDNVAESFIGDPVRISQILKNLVNNALKFTSEGEVVLTIQQHALLEDNQTKATLSFFVKDTGLGIPAEAKSKIFQPFVKIHSGAQRAEAGNGLGLAICKQLVDLMQGKIGFESTEGVGTTFWFYIDLERCLPLRVTLRPSLSRLHADKKAERYRILVAEDNEVSQKMAIKQLEKLGYKASAAGDGEQVLRYLAEDAFDLILMDCQMPKLDGYDACKAIRSASSDVSKIPIIAVSANAGSDEFVQCEAAGMNDYLVKPVTLESLSRTLKKWLPSEPGTNRCS